MVFAGRRDQVVELSTDGGGVDSGCHSARLQGPAGRVVTAARPDLWRLPRSGTYRAEVVPCWGSSLDIADLTRRRLVPLDLNAAPVHFRSGKGVTDLGVVTVPRTGRVMVRGWTEGDPQHLWDSVSYPSGTGCSPTRAGPPTSRQERPSPTA
ncbi:hypothetical protein KRR39_14195 [Nocardioides panacis]|uniref:Uncharacterized protein n=1 Tax=Nocardioides panacis TaxID=2849501 RepID=A0A975XYY2_9ACTN|nr:hypothetical protein [Nocardioides panacis]QWZ06694.1 hypothetical protein KRR39_14195 [Nocardioides panacis]